MRGWLAAAFVLLASAVSVAQTLPHGVPRLCAAPTITAVRNDAWSAPTTWSPARVPQAGDQVSVPTSVTYDANSPASLVCIEVTGTLAFKPDTSTALTVGTLQVMPQGTLTIGTAQAPVTAKAELVIANRPLNTATDPEQYGVGLVAFGTVKMHGAIKSPTFARVSVAPLTGQPAFQLAQAPSGWQPGDRVVIPDTRQLTYQERQAYSPQWEERTVAGVSGSTIHIASALQFNHQGTAGFLPHLANLTRNVTVRSESPTGTRGHTIFIDRADVDIRYVAFRDLGRTTEQPLDSTDASHIGTNQIGRYPVHFHHLAGPANAVGRPQFVLEGNVIERSRKWPIAIHNSHFGLVRGNIAYDWTGAAFVTEDGSETQNVIERNFALVGRGIGGRQGEGREGIGFWFRGTDNYVRDNVAASIRSTDGGVDSAYGFKFYPYFLGNVTVPTGPGSLLTNQRDGNATPVREFARNEVYGATESGVTFWWVGTWGDQPKAVGESVFKDTTIWNVYNKGVFVYESNRITFDGLTIRGATTDGMGIEFSDYYARDFTLRRGDIRERIVGINGSPNTDGTTIRVEDTRFENHANIQITTPMTVSYSAEALKPRRWLFSNVQLTVAAREFPYPSGDIVLVYRDQPTSGPTLLDEITVNAERVFYRQQSPTYVVPQTQFNSDGTRKLIGAPIAGLANAQAWQQYQIAVAGAVASCTSTRAGFVNAFVCPTITPRRPLPPTDLQIIP
jgi:hypothetical protein